jgi:hypothetical protein
MTKPVLSRLSLLPCEAIMFANIGGDGCVKMILERWITSASCVAADDVCDTVDFTIYQELPMR